MCVLGRGGGAQARARRSTLFGLPRTSDDDDTRAHVLDERMEIAEIGTIFLFLKALSS